MSSERQVVPVRTPEGRFGPDVRRVLDASGARTGDVEVDTARLVAIYGAMVRTRLIDEAAERLQRQGRIGFHVFSMGEEAAVIASAAALDANDWIMPCYREWGALLYRGYPLERYVDALFANVDDVAHGRQMPDHVTGRALRYGPVSAPIGTQITQAVGMASTLARRGAQEVVAVYFGDGATSSNDFHAGMTFAGAWKAPVIFLCRNNGWAISVPSEHQCGAKVLADKAVGYGMRALRCDGNDALAVHETVREARAHALKGSGPVFVEMLTYRVSGHSTSDDPTVYRDEVEVDGFRRADPIVRLRAYLEATDAWTSDADTKLRADFDAELRALTTRAEQKPAAALETLFRDVYATQTPRQAAQEASVLHGPRARTGHKS